MGTPQFSIVTATWNAAATVARCVESVRDQVVESPCEQLIVDACSTDETLTAIAACGSPRVQVISEPDEGIYDAFNKGVARANGDVVAILNSDDYYLPGALAAVAEIFEKRPDVDCVHGNIEVLRKGEPVAVKPISGWRSAGGARVFHPTFFARKSVYDAVGPFDTSYKIAADLDFFIRAKQAGFTFYYLDQVLTHFSLGGFSGAHRFSAANEVLRVMQKHSLPIAESYGGWVYQQCHNLAAAVFGGR